MKTFIEEMTLTQLKEVFYANNTLQDEVIEDMLDSEMHHISEHIDYIREALHDYDVGTGAKPYLHVRTDYNGMATLLDGLKRMDAEVPALSEKEAAEVIASLEEKLNDYANADCEREDYEELEEKAAQAAQDAADAIAAQFERNLQYCFGTEAALDYFLDFYVDVRLCDEERFYVNEGGDFTLYDEIGGGAF